MFEDQLQKIVVSYASSILIYTNHSIAKLKSNYFWFSSALPSVPKRGHGILPNELEQDPRILENIEETLGMLSQ